MNSETRKKLEEFVKRAEYIESLSYFDGEENISGMKAKKEGDHWDIEFYQPNGEQTDALLFNLRLFLQDKDDISLRRLTELYKDPGLSDNWKKEHEFYRKQLNERLEQIAAEGIKGKIIYRDVLDMFLYGKFGHFDQDDRAFKLYQQWVTSDFEYEMLHSTFHQIIIWIEVTISRISIASKKELENQCLILPLDTSLSPS